MDKFDILSDILKHVLKCDIESAFIDIQKTMVGSKLEAEFEDVGQLKIKVKGSFISTTFLIAAIINSLTKDDKKHNIDDFLNAIRRHYDFLSTDINSMEIKADSDEMGDIISELLKNPEKMEEIRRMMNDGKDK